MRRLVLFCLLLTLFCAPGQAHAASQPPKNRGLFITPIRQYLKINPRQKQDGSLTVADITDKAIIVTMSYEQFSAADYTYDYQFKPPTDKWITFSQTQVQLGPDKSQTIHYTVDVPKNASPGGHYFTLFATTTFTNDAAPSKVRAASVMYVTVAGDLRLTSQIIAQHVPWLALGNSIDFSLDLKDTGNTHFFVYTSGRLSGPSAKGPGEETVHLLLPSATRNVAGNTPAPFLPGVYKMTYGYRTDDGQIIQRASLLVYLPPWSWAIPVGVGFLVWWWRGRRRRV